MTRRRGAIYLPLEVTFMRDDKVLDAGERAAWLYLAMALTCKEMLTDGVITRRQIEYTRISGWRQRLHRLIEVGLVVELETDRWYLPAFLDHNESKEQILGNLAADRERKRRSARIPPGIQTESGRIPGSEAYTESKTETPFRRKRPVENLGNCAEHHLPNPCRSCAADRKATG